jgi:CYTH domain-containing protein
VASEIERKWVAEQPPAADALGAGTPYRQGYVAIDGDVTVRVRISPTQAWLTVKGGGDGLDRSEVDLELDLPDAEELWNHTGDRQLEKTRHRIPVDEYTAEVDLFAGPLDGVCVVEVEFPTVGAAEAFRAPAWFGREVTGQPEWSNASLARFGRPSE